MTGEINLYSPGNLIVEGSGKVEIDNFVVIKDGSTVVATMNGVFDFQEIPAEYHATVINYLLRNRLSLHTLQVFAPSIEQPQTNPMAAIGGRSTSVAAPTTSVSPKPWWKFWT